MAVSKSQKLATKKYNDKNYQNLAIRVKMGVRDRYHVEAMKRNLSLAEFIQYCVEKELNRNKKEQE